MVYFHIASLSYITGALATTGCSTNYTDILMSYIHVYITICLYAYKAYDMHIVNIIQIYALYIIIGIV